MSRVRQLSWCLVFDPRLSSPPPLFVRFVLQNSALQWEHRVEELAAVTAGKPINSTMLPGERWFIVDARWMDHWLEFCTSKRRMAPPGPVDNSWMLHAEQRYVHQKVEEKKHNCADNKEIIRCAEDLLLIVLLFSH